MRRTLTRSTPVSDNRARTTGPRLQILGRPGSLYTRVALILAEEAGVACDLVVLDDLMDADARSYSGNPALRIPVLDLDGRPVFGAQTICRVLAARATQPLYVIWPEALTDLQAMNAHELVRQSMAAQVQLLMLTDFGKPAPDDAVRAKTLAALGGSLRWLDRHVAGIVAALPPERTVSMFEVELFCLIEHLAFAPTVPIAPYPSLSAFATAFGSRPSARRTPFR